MQFKSTILLIALSLTCHVHQSRGDEVSLLSGIVNFRWDKRSRSQQHRNLLQEDQKPTSRCGPQCLEHGVCNEELGVCMCPRHRIGMNCEQGVANVTAVCKAWGFRDLDTCFQKGSKYCLNGCNGRGQCTGGFCYCEPGFWGTDCSLSVGPDGKPELLAGLGYRQRSKPPKIYVYELPGHCNMYRDISRLDRPLYALFWQRLLSAGVRTTDGDSADYYYIPVHTRLGQMDSQRVVECIAFLKQHYPYYNRTNGARHLIIHTGDMGRIDMNAAALAASENVTFLTHWGLHTQQPYAGWPPAHRRTKDMVIPIFVQPSHVIDYQMARTPLNPHNRGNMSHMPNKTLELFFSGRICHSREQPRTTWPACEGPAGWGKPPEDGYSAGTRQRIFHHHHHRPGYKLVLHSKRAAREMQSSRFCLAPTGAGHGKRNVLSAMAGCIPVTVTDNVLQPFEPELDWSEFSVHLPEKDIPDLHHILGNITEERFAQMQDRLYCGAQHLFFTSIFGSVLGDDGKYDAFETILEILRARRAHPGVPFKKLRDVDPALAAFMRCEPYPPDDAEVSRKHGICTHAITDGSTVHCKECENREKGASNLLMPGGAVCCNKEFLSNCTRLWN